MLGLMAKLLGMELVTDHEPLAGFLDVLESDGRGAVEALDERFPGLVDAVMLGARDLGERRLEVGKIVYFNFRVQVWPPEMFDADPSPFVRVIPKGIDVQP